MTRLAASYKAEGASTVQAHTLFQAPLNAGKEQKGVSPERPRGPEVPIPEADYQTKTTHTDTHIHTDRQTYVYFYFFIYIYIHAHTHTHTRHLQLLETDKPKLPEFQIGQLNREPTLQSKVLHPGPIIARSPRPKPRSPKPSRVQTPAPHFRALESQASVSCLATVFRA